MVFLVQDFSGKNLEIKNTICGRIDKVAYVTFKLTGKDGRSISHRRKTMKKLTSILFVVTALLILKHSGLQAQAAATTQPAPHLVLITQNFELTITYTGPEGDDAVEYYGVSKRTGKSICLEGFDWHTIGPDGTPGRFLGYKFENGNITYFVTEDGELTVMRNHSEVLVDETGTWIN